MAGDWIKMRQDLHEDPAVVQIALLTDIDEDSVVGKLHKLWCWADKHTTDGTAPAITKTWVDRYVSKSGFAEAMTVAGWISFSDSGVLFPSFDIHNGHSAKSRAEASVRQRLSRKNRDEGVTGVDRTSIPKPFVRHVLNRDNYTCVYCGTESDEATESSRKSRLSIDHIIPETRGGSASVANLACCCRKCNNEKNDRTPEEWGLEPTFLQDGVTYKDGQMSQKNRDTPVTKTLPEKRREEKSNTNTNTERDARATRMPADQALNQEWLDFCKAERPDLDPITTFAKFKDHWIAKPGKAGTKLNWLATWRNWVREERQQTIRMPAVERESFAERDERKARERYEEFTGKRPATVIDITPTQLRVTA